MGSLKSNVADEQGDGAADAELMRVEDAAEYRVEVGGIIAAVGEHAAAVARPHHQAGGTGQLDAAAEDRRAEQGASRCQCRAGVLEDRGLSPGSSRAGSGPGG